MDTLLLQFLCIFINKKFPEQQHSSLSYSKLHPVPYQALLKDGTSSVPTPQRLPTQYLWGAGAKNGRNGTKFTAHHGELLLPCGDGHSCSLLSSPSSLASDTPRDGALGSPFQCLTSSQGRVSPVYQWMPQREHSPVALGPVPLPEFVDNTKCWDTLCVTQSISFQVFNRHQAATVFNWFWFELLSENGNLYIPPAVPWAGKTSESPYLILSFVIQANCSKPNWLQPSSPGALFGPAKGHFSSMFKAYSTLTAQKLKADIPLQQKDQRTKSAFSALYRIAAFIPIQPSGCDSSLQHWETLLFMLQVTRGVAHSSPLCPDPACHCQQGGTAHPQTLPQGQDLKAATSKTKSSLQGHRGAFLSLIFWAISVK